MKVFHATITRPFIYGLNDSNEQEAHDIAWVKFKEAIVVAKDQEEVDEKIRATLPPENQKVRDILSRSSIKGEYYSVQAKELKGNDGVYFC